MDGNSGCHSLQRFEGTQVAPCCEQCHGWASPAEPDCDFSSLNINWALMRSCSLTSLKLRKEDLFLVLSQQTLPGPKLNHILMEKKTILRWFESEVTIVWVHLLLLLLSVCWVWNWLFDGISILVTYPYWKWFFLYRARMWWLIFLHENLFWTWWGILISWSDSVIC